ncbi:uncharacterized protein LOC128253676 isoform X1 [Drosophila gunungcola]|uniref:uncharacterized protein LOC128253676 isoform X1 n=1 Tax=Drosophila gunungcola TaxID=103775 RepID=UPI0022E987A9|nr:uncharacterized protein LOC128253676 isoform X1 [Drosophila gunungcola]
MNFYVLSWLLFFLAPGGCPIYSIDLATLEVPTNYFQNELTLQSMLSSELREYRNGLNERIGGQHSPPPRHNPQPDWLKDLSKAARSTSETSVPFLGTNLFGNCRKNCFSTEDIALMSARKDFELLVPKSFPQCLLSDSIVHMLVRYFNTVNQLVKRMSDEDTRLILQRSFYDALGGYLRYYLLPMAQVSFYAGRLKLSTVERLVNIYRQCKTALNTNGNGWRTPDKDILCRLKGAKIQPLKLPTRSCKSQEDASSCALLDQSCLSQEPGQDQMVVPLPRLEAVDEYGFLNNIYVPFRKRRIYNLRSPKSAFVLVRFFQALTSCHRFLAVSQVDYNRKFLSWIRENVQMHYQDEVFYPGLGGILQIKERLLIQKNSPEEEYQEQTPADKKEEAGSPSSSYEGDSRKLSRSAIQWQEAPDSEQEQAHQDEWLSGLERVHTRQDELEECRECDNDDSLIWCIAAFLALLLLLILLIICCCMKRGRKKKAVRPPVPEAPPPKEKRKKEPLIAKTTQLEVKNVDEGVNRYYYSGSGRHSTSQRSVQDDRYPANPELDSYTSTSSLGCQFNRKCVPLKFARAKGEEYYVPDKGRDELNKQVPALAIHSEDSFARRARQPAKKPALKSNESPNRTSEGERTALDKEKKRQRHYGMEVKRKRDKDTEASQKKEQTKSSEERKQSTPERRTTNRVRIVTDNESTDDPRLDREKSEEKPETSAVRKKGGTEAHQFNSSDDRRLTPAISPQSVKDSPSWETTFEDN